MIVRRKLCQLHDSQGNPQSLISSIYAPFAITGVILPQLNYGTGLSRFERAVGKKVTTTGSFNLAPPSRETRLK